MKIVECPRDAWQGLPRLIPAEDKAAYLRALLDAGFRHIDAVSFVSRSAVPQMADAEAVLASVAVPEGTELIGIVVNERGAERAVAAGKVTTLGFPYSVSPTFLRRNQGQSPEESLAQLQASHRLAAEHGLGLVVYLSVAFGNPYGDPWSVAAVAEACKLLAAMGISQISLADTVGAAGPELVSELVGRALEAVPEVEVGVHLHTRPERAHELVVAAYRAGCRRFDAAIGGLGGCPFAQAELVGNLPTETLLRVLRELGAEVPEIRGVGELRERSAGFARDFGTHAS